MAKIQGPGILNQWSCHLPGCGKRYQDFFKYVIEEFDKKQIPDLQPYWEKIGSTLGRKKDFWAVDYDDCTSYIAAEVMGNDLYVCWLIYNPKWAKEMSKSNSATRAIFWSMFGSDIGDLIEMSCFGSVTKDCAEEAVQRLFEEENIDKSKITRASSGVLGPI